MAANGRTLYLARRQLGLNSRLHSLRRYWPVMFCTEVAAAAVAVAAVWLTLKLKYEAEAVL